MRSLNRAMGIVAAILGLGMAAPAARAGSSSVLVYSCGHGFFNLCQINSDGRGQKRLTHDGGPSYTKRYDSPSLSRNGRKLAYLRGPSLYVLDRLTGHRTGPISNTASLARMSPDGSKVGDIELYPSAPPALGSVLTACVFRSSGTGSRAGRNCEGPAGSFGFTNRNRVLASRSDQYDPAYRRYETGICVLNPAKRGCGRFLAFELGHDLSDPAVSPDGKLLAVTRSLPGHALGGIALYEYATGKLVRELTTGTTDSEPAWAPDGTRLAFVRGANTGAPRIYTVSVKGGSPRALVKGRSVTWGR